MGTGTPSQSPTCAAHGPVAKTTASHGRLPAVVSTAVTLAPSVDDAGGVGDHDLRAHRLGGGCERLGEALAAERRVAARIEGANRVVGDSRFEFAQLRGVEPFGCEVGVGVGEDVVGGSHPLDVGVVERDADGGGDLGLEIYAGALG